MAMSVCKSAPATVRCPLHSGRVLVSRPVVLSTVPTRRPLVIRSSKGDGDGPLQGIVSTGTKLVEQAASFIPESVPRPVAKGAVALGMGLFVFGMVKQVVSGFITLVVLGGIAYYFFTRSGPGADDDDTPKSTKKRGGADDLDDPLSEARRIMDKYK